MKPSGRKLPAAILAIAIALWVSVEPALHAARIQDREPSLSERIYAAAADGERALKDLPFEDRGAAAYPRVIDLYRQVTETAADTALADRALVRMADLTREMALRTGDASQFDAAIDSYRRLITTRPKSPYVGDALVAVAQIYEYDLQDVDGATAAYREIQRRFPESIAGREASANLVRLDTSVGAGTSVVGAIGAPGAEIALLPGAEDHTTPRVLNVRSFAGPSYARIVVDLSGALAFAERRTGTQVTYALRGAELSRSLLGRRLSTPLDSIIKGMRVEQTGDGVLVTLDLATLESSTAYLTDDPSRLVIDLRGAQAKSLSLPTSLGAISRDAAGDIIAKSIPAPSMPSDIGPLPAAPGAPEIVPAPGPGAPGKRPVRCIVIDPGHGGQDTGTIGPGGLYEKDVTLDVARRLRASLRAELPGVELVLTRDSDRFVSLDERTAVANARDADLFVSIHANASQSSTASGVETFVPDQDALAKGRVEQARRAGNVAFASVSFASQAAESRSLAGFVQGSLVSGLSAKHPTSAKDRGIKHASFAVLRGAHMPSILAEVSFVSNPEDENRLRTPAFRQRIASSLTAGIRGYVRAIG